MPPKLKQILVVVTVFVVAYLILFKTNMVISRMNSFPDWANRYIAIESGSYKPSRAIIHIESENDLRDDYLHYLNQYRQTLLLGVGGKNLLQDHSGKLAWRYKEKLYMANLGPLLQLPENFDTDRWKLLMSNCLSGNLNKNNKDEEVLAAFAVLYFNELVFVNKFGDTQLGTEKVINIQQLRKESRE